MNGILDVALNLSGLYRFYAKRLEKEVVRGDRPNHIAIVLDGNRRWAKRNLVMQIKVILRVLMRLKTFLIGVKNLI